MKIRSVGAEFFHVNGGIDGRTEGRRDMTELRVAFHNFANVPKIYFLRHSEHSTLKKPTFCDRDVTAALPHDLLCGPFINKDRNVDDDATSSTVIFFFLNCFYNRSSRSSRKYCHFVVRRSWFQF